MIGPRVGTNTGLRVGVGTGVNWDEIGGDPTTLTVSMTDSTDPVISGVNFAYSVVVTNTGANAATNVSAVVNLDATLTFLSGSGTGWTVNRVGQVVTCTRATLAPGAAPTITITVTTADAASTESSTADAIAGNAPAAVQSVQTTVVNLVERDATSLIRVPSSLTQWQNFNAYHVAIGTANFPNVTPSSLYLMQEASGNLADSIDGITLTATGASLIYQQAVAGWSRKAFAIPDGLVTHNAQNTTTAVDISTTSALWMLYVRMPAGAPAAVRRLARINATGMLGSLSTTPRIQCVTGGAGGSTVNGTSNPTGAVHLFAIQANRALPQARIFTDQEKVAGTVGTYATVALGIGSSAGNSADVGYLYGPLFTGAAAELSDAQVKSLAQALGFTIPWS
jgi:hypothetical protein